MHYVIRSKMRARPKKSRSVRLSEISPAGFIQTLKFSSTIAIAVSGVFTVFTKNEERRGGDTRKMIRFESRHALASAKHLISPRARCALSARETMAGVPRACYKF